MKIACMQPYLFPYIGYYQLINVADVFVIFDIVQYIEKGWMNRNRILSSNLETEWVYFSLPINKHSRNEIISNITVNHNTNWEEAFMGKLSYYHKIRAPFYDEVRDLIFKFLEQKFTSLTDYAILSLMLVFEYLGKEFIHLKCSELNLDFSNVQHPGDWAFEISRQLKAKTYINPVGGKDLFNQQKFEKQSIRLELIRPEEIVYKQSRRCFIPWLSIIDVMMFNSPEKINSMLDEYVII